MQLHISHLTRYEYDGEVQLLPHLLYLRPRDNPLMEVSGFRLTFKLPVRVDWMRDDFDNLPASVQFLASASALEIRSDCEVRTADAPPFDFLMREYAQVFPFAYEPLHRDNLEIYLAPPDAVTQSVLRAWLGQRFTAEPTNTVAWLMALNAAIHDGIVYQRRDLPGIQSVTETITRGFGSCRDYAVLFIGCARMFGLAARFVSGYLFDPAIAGVPGRGDMHAWAEVFLPGAGWRGLDPTHGIFCHNAYVPVAHAVVAESVNPIQGAFRSSLPVSSRLSINVQVRRVA